jgi:hypothetical protein
VTVPLVVTRSASHFSASFVVDRFLPGRCGWHFMGVAADIQKGKRSSGPTLMIHAYEPGRSMETKTIDSSAMPVTLRCRTLPSAGFNCISSFGSKSGQWLIEAIQSIEVNIVDADE